MSPATTQFRQGQGAASPSISEPRLIVLLTRLKLLLTAVCPSIFNLKVHREDAHQDDVEEHARNTGV